jgi:hypothetical protein
VWHADFENPWEMACTVLPLLREWVLPPRCSSNNAGLVGCGCMQVPRTAATEALYLRMHTATVRIRPTAGEAGSVDIQYKLNIRHKVDPPLSWRPDQVAPCLRSAVCTLWHTPRISGEINLPLGVCYRCLLTTRRIPPWKPATGQRLSWTAICVDACACPSPGLHVATGSFTPCVRRRKAGGGLSA